MAIVCMETTSHSSRLAIHAGAGPFSDPLSSRVKLWAAVSVFLCGAAQGTITGKHDRVASFWKAATVRTTAEIITEVALGLRWFRVRAVDRMLWPLPQAPSGPRPELPGEKQNRCQQAAAALPLPVSKSQESC